MQGFKTLFLAATMSTALSSGATSFNAADMQQLFGTLQSVLDAQTLDLIRWRVGDFHELKVDFMVPGSGRKEAVREDTARNAIWLHTTLNILGQTQKTESLISRSNGEVLELIVNGEKQDPNQRGEMEIIEQSETRITVPAGTFDCFYVKAKVRAQGQEQVIEAWVNPIDVNLDGNLKTTIQSQFGPISIILQNFGPRR